MRWTRRQFGTCIGALASALGLSGVASLMTLRGRAYFEDWRALPGMAMTLHVEVARPSETTVTLLARVAGKTTEIGAMSGASSLEVRIPYIESGEDSYELIARVEDAWGRHCDSEPLEVLTERFQFGM